MTIPNRTVSITGIFAADANTTIPANPVSGISYRDTAMTGTIVREGWPFKTIVDSSKFNQAMFEYSSVTAQFEKYGFLPWSNLTDYVTGSVCLGSNGILYQARQDTGPTTTPYDPTTTPTVWDPVILGVTEFLFHHVWSEYILNRLDWLRADTFSWQDGEMYSNAYDHLVSDIAGVSSSTETIGSYTITYYKAEDGHKIVMADQETTVANIYAESGIAWYYILDTTNQKFKLPRTKYGFTGLRDEVGKYVEAGLPNITGTFNAVWELNRGRITSGAFGSSATGGQNESPDNPGSGQCTWDFDASRSSSVYGNSSTVQPPATQMYLYFYVGQFSQSATEQTAGLNAELFNGKVDLDAANLSTAGKSLISGLGMPSNNYNDLTLLASGSTYTAPANGYFYFAKIASASNQYMTMYVDNGGTPIFAITQVQPLNGAQARLFLPVKKGDVVGVGYDLGGQTRRFCFVYAEGEPNV